MGGSKTTNKTTQAGSTTTTIPQEIRDRGTKITNAAMGEYFDPATKYQTYDYNTYKPVGEATTGQLNNYHTQAGNQYTAAGTNYQPYFNTANNTLNNAMGNTASTYGGPTGGAAGYNANSQTATAYNGLNDVNRNMTGATNTAGSVAGPDFNSQTLSRFMNPYQDAVISRGVSDIGRNLQQQRLADQSRAAQAGAFGGARHGVIDSEAQKTAADTLQNYIGSQLFQGYNAATNQYNTDYGQGLQAQQLNNAAAGQNFDQGLQQGTFNNNAYQTNWSNQMEANRLANQAAMQNFNQGLAAQQLGNQASGQNFNQALAALGINNQAAGQNFNQGLAAAGFQQGLGAANQSAAIAGGDAALKLGNVVTAQDEAQRQNAYNYGYQDRRNYPMEVYERLAGMNAMQPVNRTSTTTGTSSGTQGQSGGWLGPALGAAGSIGRMFAGSDERMKEEIHERNPEEVLGAFAKVTPYTYAYKESAQRAHPEVTAAGERRGFMAQDYERAFGRASGPTLKDGLKTIDIPNVLGDLVAAVNGLEKRTRALKPGHGKGK